MKRFWLTKEPEKYTHFKEVQVVKYGQHVRVAFLEWLRKQEAVAFDIETRGGDQFSGEILLYSFCDGQRVYTFDGFTIPIASIPDGKNMWGNACMLAHNAAYELKWLEPLHIGHLIPRRLYCTMVAEGKLLMGSGESLSLVNTLDRRGIQLPAAMNKDVRSEFNDSYVKHEEYHVLYNAGDTEILHELRDKQQKVIDQLDLNYHIHHLHMPLCRILVEIENAGWKLNENQWKLLAQDAENAMESKGMAMDNYLRNHGIKPKDINPDFVNKEDRLRNALKRQKDALRKVDSQIKDKRIQYQGREDKLYNLKVWKTLLQRQIDLSTDITEKDKELSMMSSKSIGLNWSSTKQVVQAWQALGLNPMPMAKSNTTGKFQPSLADAARQKWLLENKNHPHYRLIELLDEYQGYSKHVSSFGNKFIEKYKHPVTGKYHTTYKQVHVTTGRLASGDAKNGRFNSQQIPRSNDLRNCFLADSDDYLIATCDLSGAELVTMAALANDQRLLELSEGDMHSYFANKGWKAIYESRGLPYEEKDIISSTQNKDKRTDYKPMMFGTV